MPETSAIALDDEATWPGDLVRMLENRFTELKGYEKENRRIDRLAERDVMFRIHRPENRHQSVHDDVIADCEACLAGAEIVGYHCTRLHADEIEHILNHGMKPSSEVLLVERLRKRGDADDIPPQLLSRLLADHQAADSNRSGMIWFIFTKRLLREENGVSRFFRSWGGESLYNSHEDDPETGTTLRSIGVPCIVEAAMPVRNLTAHFLALKLYGCFMSRRGVTTEYRDDSEGYLTEPLPAGGIRRIIRFEEPAFEELTGCKSWESPLHP